MYNTLALFALFTIGSADFQCDDYADAATAENKPCSNDGNLIGTCNASTTCIVTSTCANDGENCGHVGNATFMGKCVKPDASAGTCFADSAIPAGQCAPGNLATTYCKHATSNFIGKCNAASTNLCVVASVSCTADGKNCGPVGNAAFMGKCVKPSGAAGTCFADSAIPAGQCAPGNLSTTYCKHATSNYIGKCNAASTNLCVVASVSCTVDGENCGHVGNAAFMGKCVKPDASAGTCYADSAIPAGQCAPANLATTYCVRVSDKSIGKCNAAGTNLCVAASVTCLVDGKTCGHSSDSALMGRCDLANTKCAALIPAGQCAPGNVKDTACTHANLIGKCDGETSTNMCITAKACTGNDDTNCGDGATKTLLAGKCHKNSQTCQNNSINKGRCAPSDKSGTQCTNGGDLVGTCDGASPNLCKTTEQCTVDGASCGSGTLTGKCVASGDKTCFYDGSIADGKCAPGTSGMTYCKRGTYVGMCDGIDASNNCVIDAQCYVDGKACGHRTDATLMGKCVAGVPQQMGRCYSTEDITVGECAPGTKKDTYCTHKKSNTVTHVGKCKGGNTNNTCDTATMCTEVGPYCGHSTDTALKGQCITGGFCFSTVGLGGKCAPGTTATSSCMKGMFLGLCAGGSTANECNTTSPCKDSLNYTTCKNSLKGWCDSENCVPTVSCENTQTYCKNDALIGMCNGTSGNANRVCITAPGHAELCETKETEDACGNSDVASGFTGYCEAAKGNCKMGKPITIHYKIQLKPEALDTKPERVAFATKLEGNAFNSDLMAKLSRAVGDNEIPDCPVQSSVANGKFADSCKATSNEKGKDTCDLICDDTFSLKRVHTRKCSALGKWIGVEGMCGKRCAATGGTVLADKTTLRFEGSTPEEGTLDCMAPAGFQKVTDDSYCILSCPTGYRVRYPSTKMCDTNTEWTGTRGSCELSTDVLASATLVLEDGDDHANIVQEQDEMFNNKFKASVAALLQGVSPENVIIVDIKNYGSRRLNEKAVLVNYSITEGATALDSPEDDARLALGGLRGIR